MEHLILKQNKETARIRTQMENKDTEHQQQIKNMGEANEKTLRDQREENYDKNQKLNREILNLKEENTRNLEEIRELRQEIREARSNRQDSFINTHTPRRQQVAIQITTSPNMEGASFESTNAPYMQGASFESTTTPYTEEASFESTNAPYMEEDSFESTTTSYMPEDSIESTYTPDMDQDERIRWRTNTALYDEHVIATTRDQLAAVQDTSFRDAILNTVSLGAAAVGAGVSLAFPPLAPIVAPVAVVVSAGAQLVKKCSIM